MPAANAGVKCCGCACPGWCAPFAACCKCLAPLVICFIELDTDQANLHAFDDQNGLKLGSACPADERAPFRV